tara:strand:- start:67 stop:252 length:186 start_codon:yes stop_codon:yes gene_type:complete
MNDRGRIKELVNLILEIQKTKDWIGNALYCEPNLPYHKRRLKELTKLKEIKLHQAKNRGLV